jgi:hypothetical protein
MTGNQLIASMQASQISQICDKMTAWQVIVCLLTFKFNPVLTTPVLSFNVGSGNLTWTSTVTPTNWQVWAQQPAGIGSYFLYDTLPGGTMTEVAPTFGNNYYVVGVSGTGAAQTNRSNIVGI